MALVNPYCTVEQVQDELRNRDDALTQEIERAINSASRQIDRWKGRDYFFHDYSSNPLILRGGMMQGLFAGRYLLLPYSPVITLTSLSVNDDAQAEGDDYVWAAEDFKILNLNCDWPTRSTSDKITLVGTFGYYQESESDVPRGLPAEINKIAITIAAALSGHNQKEVTSVDGTKVQVYDKNIPRAAEVLLGTRAIVM